MKDKWLKKKVFLIFFVLIVQMATAQKSYIYIELIKTIPCKVMQNGNEVPQLSKNFVVLNINDRREQNIDIEFGADLYPKQNFIVDAVPNASYGYKLARSGESSFYLLDLINNGKIIESNSAVNIGLPTELNTINFGKNQSVRMNVSAEKNDNWIKKAFSKKDKPRDESKIADRKREPEIKKEEPKYGVIEVINSNKAESKNIEIKDPEKKGKKQPKKPVQQVKANCYLIASDREVESFIEKINVKTDDEVKLLIARKKQFTGCLTVKHIIQIAENFSTQYGRYNFVKIGMSNVANPQDLRQCESLFKAEAYKNKFYRMIDPD